MRRAITFFVVAIVTAAASTAWLSEEGPTLPTVPAAVREWDADGLAAQEGVVDPVAEEAVEPVPPEASEE